MIDSPYLDGIWTHRGKVKSVSDHRFTSKPPQLGGFNTYWAEIVDTRSEIIIKLPYTVGIRLSDTSGNWMAKNCPIAEWSSNWMVTWIMDKKSSTEQVGTEWSNGP